MKVVPMKPQSVPPVEGQSHATWWTLVRDGTTVCMSDKSYRSICRVRDRLNAYGEHKYTVRPLHEEVTRANVG